MALRIHTLTPAWLRGPALLVCLALGGCPSQPQAETKPADDPGRPSPSAATVAMGEELDPQKQEKIWDLEHRSFALETHLGKPLVAALRTRRPERLQTFLAGDFRGEMFAAGEGRRRTAGPVSEVVLRAGERARTEVDAEAFARSLVAWASPFELFRGMRLAVTHIEPVGDAGDRWAVRMLLMATGEGGGAGLVERIAEFEAEFRFTDDASLKAGGALARATILSDRLRTSPQPLMEEVTESSGLAALGLPDNWLLPPDRVRMHRYLVAVEDYDRDGFLDIAVGNNEGPPLLLRSERGRRFRDVAGTLGIMAGDRNPRLKDINALVSWIDYDNDDYPDLLAGYRLYHNVGGKRFEDVTAASGLVFDRVPFGALVFDYDGDGLLDLYILYQKGFKPRPPGKRPWVGDPYAGAENHLWRNEGGGKFRNVTAESGAGGGSHQTFAATNLFFDDDALPDIYLANDFGANVLLRNRGDGTFEDITASTGTGDFATSMGVSAGDLDNDGTTELYVANMYSKMGRRIVAHIDEDDYRPGLYDMIVGSLAGNRLYRLGDQGRCDELSQDLGVNTVGWAFAPAMVDLDADGWLDLYATAGFISQDREKPDG